jgi:hypothetical protein
MNLQTLYENSAFLWSFIELSQTVQLYIISMLFLLLVLCYEVWNRSVRLSLLNHVSLKTVESTHPHLPSVRIIVATCICSLALLIIALQSCTGLTPFADPTKWMMIVALFVISGSIGLMAETKRHGASDAIYSCILGTAEAFFLFVLGSVFGDPLASTLLCTLMMIVLLLCVGLARRMLLRQWSERTHTLSLAVFFLWILFLCFQ